MGGSICSSAVDQPSRPPAASSAGLHLVVDVDGIQFREYKVASILLDERDHRLEDMFFTRKKEVS